jgi:NAD(P)-dependent dehydrogenase (short-subunit alcohol dehydrogenase family)
MGGKLTFPGGGAYHATKYAVEALSDALRFEVAGFGVKVVLIEPGLIRTEFGSTLAENTPEGDGPYAAFNAEVSKTAVDAYEPGSLVGRLGGGPETVARTIEKAISARRPRARYTVTPSAKLMISQRALLPDRAWDAVMRSQFSQPGRGK